MKKTMCSFIMASTLVLGGCASITNGTSQEITISSNTPGTSLFVNGQFIGQDEVQTTFMKRKNYFISAEKEGCDAVGVEADKSVDPVSMGGILVDFGLFTILVVDMFMTGAWKQFDETSFVLDPFCESDAGLEAVSLNVY